MWRRRWAGLGVLAIAAAGTVGVVGAQLLNPAAAARTIAVGPYPWAVSVDPRTGHAFVVERTSGPNGMSLGGGTLSIVDPRRGNVMRTVPVGTDPRAVAIDENHGRIFVANDDDASVSMLDARTGALLRTARVGGQPRALTVDARTGHVFVVNTGDGTVSMLDGRTGTALRTIHIGSFSFLTPVTIAAAADRVLVASGRTLTVLDARSGIFLRTVILQGDVRRMAVDDRTGQVFLVGDSGLGVLDPRHGWALRTLATGGNLSAVAVDGAHDRVYVADTGARDNAGRLQGAGSVSVVDAGSGHVLRTVTVGVAPSALAVDARTGRVVVVNAGGAVAQSGLWSWLPRWLPRGLPFLPSDTSADRTVAGSVSLLDPLK